MENNGSKRKKPDEGLISETDKNQILRKDKSEPEDRDVKTQIFPQQAIPEKEESGDTDRIESVDLAIEERIKKLEEPKKKDYRLLIGVLLVGVVLVVALLVFQRGGSIINPVFSEKSSTDQTDYGSDSDQYIPLDTDSSKAIKKEEIKTVVLPNDIFDGTAPIQVKETGAIISVEKDPELAAIADALLKRISVIYGTTIGKRKEITREISSGGLQNFKITGITSKQLDNIIAGEISVKTPSGGTFAVKNGILDSIQKTDYDQIHKNLKEAGIIVTKEVFTEEKVVKIKLAMEKGVVQADKNDFLIGSQNVGEIMLRMPISEMKQVLKGNYRMIKRNIMVEDKYFSVYKVEDKNKTPLYFVYEQNGRIWGIQIVDSKFKTLRGVGIDSSLGKIRALYSRVMVNVHPKNVTFITIDDLEIKFFLQEEGINFDKKEFPLQTPVSYIILGKSPYLD